MKKSDLPATPPADEALGGAIAVLIELFSEQGSHDPADCHCIVEAAQHIDDLYKSHAEQEKAAADAALAKEITWHIANLAYAYGFRGSPFIQNELKLAQERLAELRDGDKVSPPLPEGDGKA
jgi:hypothetical protein